MSIDGKQITDYSAEFNKSPWIIEYLKDSDFMDILENTDIYFNELESVFFDLYLNIWLETAEGVQLDVLGKILDFARQGRDDESYRALLYAKVYINISSGEPESVIAAVNSMFIDVTIIEYTPVYPAKFRIYTDGTLLILDEYLLVDYVSDEIIDYDGNNIGTNVEDFTALSVLLQTIPSGVGMLWCDAIVDYEGNFLVDYDDNIIVGTYFI